MFQFKNKTLALAVSIAFGLTACGDNAQVTQKEIKKEEPKKLSLSEQVEQKIDAMIAENKQRNPFSVGDLPNIQKRVFELFPQSNTRMEKTAENCRWYVERELIPAWSPKITADAESEFEKVFQKEKGDKILPNKKGEPNLKTMALIKEFFFIDGKLFDEDKLNDDNNVHTFFCTLMPETYGFYWDNERNGSIIFGSFFYKKGGMSKSFLKVFSDEFIVNQKTNVSLKDFGSKSFEVLAKDKKVKTNASN